MSCFLNEKHYKLELAMFDQVYRRHYLKLVSLSVFLFQTFIHDGDHVGVKKEGEVFFFENMIVGIF